MPCYETRAISVELIDADKDLLRAAMIELGFPRYSYINNVITVRERNASREELERIKQAYARQVVLATAKKFNWQIKEVKANVFEVVKR